MKVLVSLLLLVAAAWGQSLNIPCGINVPILPGLAKVVATCQTGPCSSSLNYLGGSSCPSGSQCCWLNAEQLRVGVPVACSAISPLVASCQANCPGLTTVNAICETGTTCCWFGGLGR